MKDSRYHEGDVAVEEPSYEVRMRRARRRAAKHGLVLRSSRTRNGRVADFGACWLQDANYGFITVGDPVYSRLDDLEEALAEMEATS